jgi:hypothetical protein
VAQQQREPVRSVPLLLELAVTLALAGRAFSAVDMSGLRLNSSTEGAEAAAGSQGLPLEMVSLTVQVPAAPQQVPTSEY